jgi:uncharacterized damage-inducible protein DinB
MSKVLAVVKDIPDEAYHKDMGLFFHSLHATLNRSCCPPPMCRGNLF